MAEVPECRRLRCWRSQVERLRHLRLAERGQVTPGRRLDVPERGLRLALVSRLHAQPHHRLGVDRPAADVLEDRLHLLAVRLNPVDTRTRGFAVTLRYHCAFPAKPAMITYSSGAGRASTSSTTRRRAPLLRPVCSSISRRLPNRNPRPTRYSPIGIHTSQQVWKKRSAARAVSAVRAWALKPVPATRSRPKPPRLICFSGRTEAGRHASYQLAVHRNGKKAHVDARAPPLTSLTASWSAF